MTSIVILGWKIQILKTLYLYIKHSLPSDKMTWGLRLILKFRNKWSFPVRKKWQYCIQGINAGSLTEEMGLLSSNTCQRLWHMVIYCWVDSVTLFSWAFISSATFCERVLTASFTLILLKLSSSRLFSVRLHIIFVCFHADKLSIYDPIKHTVCLVSMFEWIGDCCLWIHCCTNYSLIS